MVVVRRRGPWFTAIVIAIALCAASCTSGDDSSAASTTAAGTTGATTKSTSGSTPGAKGGMTSDGKVVFGAFNFSESETLANIYAQAAVAAGVPAEVVSVGAREVVYPQLFNGELGVVPEYSGTAVVALGGLPMVLSGITSPSGPSAPSGFQRLRNAEGRKTSIL